MPYKTTEDWKENLYQAFHNMPFTVDERTKKFYDIAEEIDSHILSIRKADIEAVEEWVNILDSEDTKHNTEQMDYQSYILGKQRTVDDLLSHLSELKEKLK
jgi:hypothetical protein